MARPKRKEDFVYAKVDVQLLGNPKMLRASGREPRAFELYVRGLLWSKQAQSDGEIPFAAVSLLGFRGDALPVARALVTEGLWHERAEGFYVHDYARYQVLNSERMAMSRARKRAADERWKRHRQRENPDMQLALQTQSNANARLQTQTQTLKEEENPIVRPPAAAPPRAEIEQVWNAYHTLHPQQAFTPDKRQLIGRRVATYGTATCLAAIEGNHLDPWCNGENAEGKKWHSLELCLRPAKIEGYAELAAGHTNGGGEGKWTRERLDAAALELEHQHAAEEA